MNRAQLQAMGMFVGNLMDMATNNVDEVFSDFKEDLPAGGSPSTYVGSYSYYDELARSLTQEDVSKLTDDILDNPEARNYIAAIVMRSLQAIRDWYPDEDEDDEDDDE